jgi:regulator of sigma E protease
VAVANPGMPASRAGITMDDVIVSMDGKPVGSFFDLQLLTAEKPLGEPMVIDILRAGEPMTITVMPEPQERMHPVTGEIVALPTIGIRADGIGGINPVLVSASLTEAMMGGVNQMVGIVTNTVNYIGDIVFAEADTSQLSGPVRIAMISGEKADEGFKAFMFLIAVISTSIGLLNLFPIPVLDGGHLMFYALEAIRGRPAEDFLIKVSTVVGLSLVLLLMVFATYNDLIRL